MTLLCSVTFWCEILTPMHLLRSSLGFWKSVKNIYHLLERERTLLCVVHSLHVCYSQRAGFWELGTSNSTLISQRWIETNCLSQQHWLSWSVSAEGWNQEPELSIKLRPANMGCRHPNSCQLLGSMPAPRFFDSMCDRWPNRMKEEALGMEEPNQSLQHLLHCLSLCNRLL